MLSRDEAAEMQSKFDQASMAILNEQVKRTVMTQVLATGIYRVLNEVFVAAVAPYIAADDPPDDGMDLSDIIVTDDDDPGGNSAPAGHESDTVDTGDKQDA